MKRKTAILLINSYPPRQRVISDTALENSLAVLRTYLEARDIGVEVIDDQRIGALENGIPRWCQGLLKNITKLQLKVLQHKTLAGLLFLTAWPLHALALYRRRKYMRRRIGEIVDEVQRQNVPIVGIKLWYGDAYVWGRELAAEVRRRCPGTVVIAGGPQVKVYGDIVLGDGFDLAIMGPGEEILEKVALLHRQVGTKQLLLEKVGEIYGGRFIEAGGFSGNRETVARQMAAQTVPVYRDVDIRDKILFHTIVDGVGCSWNSCNFCSHTRCSVAPAFRPAGDIVDEISVMLRRGIAFFRFSSSETSLAQGRKIAEAILARGLDIRFSMFVRAVKPTAQTLEDYRVMIRAGLRAVFMGGETGHDGVNTTIMNKGVGRKEIIDTIATIRLASDALGLPCRVGLSLIYPCPLPADVTLDEVYRANTALIDATLPDTVIVNPPGPFPATRWFDEADKFGFRFADGPEGLAKRMMQYEYSIYKPAELWPDLGFTLQGQDVKALLKETGRLRAYAAGIGIPTDISDEYLMMTEAIGMSSRLDMMKFKRETLLDIISGSTGYTREIAAAINAASRQLAMVGTNNARRRRETTDGGQIRDLAVTNAN
ncbi:MAG: radical SAM protein [Negativicutes bacterium]|nr:radical SAM protein [Negativicutes bacterium]